jgi:hypothetical protein
MKASQPLLHGVEGLRGLANLARAVFGQRRAVQVLAQRLRSGGQVLQRAHHPAHSNEGQPQHRWPAAPPGSAPHASGSACGLQAARCRSAAQLPSRNCTSMLHHVRAPAPAMGHHRHCGPSCRPPPCTVARAHAAAHAGLRACRAWPFRWRQRQSLHAAAGEPGGFRPRRLAGAGQTSARASRCRRCRRSTRARHAGSAPAAVCGTARAARWRSGARPCRPATAPRRQRAAPAACQSCRSPGGPRSASIDGGAEQLRHQQPAGQHQQQAAEHKRRSAASLARVWGG